MFTIKVVNYFFILILISNCINLISADRRNHHNNNNRNNHNNNHDNNRKENQFNNKPSDNNDKHGLDEDMKNPLGKDDFDRAKGLDERFFAVNDKILYGGKFFEGDIVDDLLDGVSDEKNAISNPNSHWPDGRVPYVISHEFNHEERSVIARAINEYHTKTCIRFEPYTGSESNYIHLIRGSGCSSRVGMTGGVQQVTLGQGCVTVGIVEHELMHALGFVHEQSRTDRDQYIRVNYHNIRRGLESNFRKYSVDEITSLNEPYDYASVLHYGPTAFSTNGSPTIEPLKQGSEIGQRVGFSEIDLEKINKLYRCGRQGQQNHRPNQYPSADRHRPNRERPGYGSRPDNSRPDYSRPDHRPESGSFRPKPPGFGGSGNRPGEGYFSTHRPSIVDGIFGGFQPNHRPGSGYRPDHQGHRPGFGGGDHRPDYGHNGHNQGHRPDNSGYKPSTVDPDSEYELGGGGGGSGYSTTHRPSGFGGYSTTRRPYGETETEYSHIRPSYTSTYRPYESSRPDYENNNHSNNRRPIRPSYERETTTFRPFGTNIGNIGSIGSITSGISSLFGNRRPGSSIIDAIRPGNSNGQLSGLGGNRGSSLISTFLRPDRFTSLIGLLGQDDAGNQTTTKTPNN